MFNFKNKIMKIISTILSLAMIGMGIYGLAISGGETTWWITLVVGVIWLLADIIAIKKNQE